MFRSWCSVLSLITCLVIWEFAARSGLVSIALFAAPSQVALALWELLASGELLKEIWPSLRRVALGLLLGTLAGVTVGMLTGRIHLLSELILPPIQVLRPLPPVAIIPLVIVWLGIGEVAKVFSIAFASFFPIWINSHLGAEGVPRTFLWAGRSLGLGRSALLGRVVFPAAMPMILAGIRSGIAVAFVMVFVSELAGASSGIGYAISVYSLAYRTDRMMAYLFVLAGLGAATDLGLTRFMWWLFPWLRLN